MDYLKTIGIVNNGSNGRGFANPYDTAHAQDGRIFVLNRCDVSRRDAIRVGILNLDEEYLGEFGGGFGSADGQLAQPVAMAFDSRERLYITDEHNNRVSVFTSGGDFLHKWGSPGSGPGQMNGPSGIAIDADDNVYVADQHNHRVQRFSTDGEYVNGWGGRGSQVGSLDMPWGVAVDSRGDVYVADWRNDRVQKFTPEGAPLAVYGTSGSGEGQLSRPSSVDVDDEGLVYVADWGNERVQVFGQDGSPVHLLRGQATLSKWARDFFAANPDEWAKREIADLSPDLPDHLQTPDHQSSQTEAYFWGPVSVKLDVNQRLFVSETNRHRLQIYNTN